MPFQSLYCFEIKRCYVKVIIRHYIVIHDWINIMAKMIEPQDVPCKTLRGNPFESHKIDPYD